MHYTRFITEIRALEERLEASIKQFKQLFPRRRHIPHQRVKQVMVVIINNQKYIPMDNTVLTLGAGAYPPIDSLVDAGSLKAIPDAAGSLQSRDTDNHAVAVIDSNGNILPVAAGTFNLVDTNSWSYKDEDTGEQITGKVETSTTPFSVVSGPEQVLQQTTVGTPVPAGTPLTGPFPVPPAPAPAG